MMQAEELLGKGSEAYLATINIKGLRQESEAYFYSILKNKREFCFNIYIY